LIPACTTGANDAAVRAGMAYAAYLSGITLANAGLGVVHGIASVLGGLFDIPHGVICGTVVGAAARVTIDALKKQGDSAKSALAKYAKIGRLFSDNNDDIEGLCNILVEKIEEWTFKLKLPLLRSFGVSDSDIENIIDQTGNKNNPAALNSKEIRQIIEARL